MAMCGLSARSCVQLIFTAETCCVWYVSGQFQSISDMSILTGHSTSRSPGEHLLPSSTREQTFVSAQKAECENKDSTVRLLVPETQLEGSGKWH